MKQIAVVKCPYCGNHASLIDSQEIYKTSYGHIWICRPCDAYTGVHANSRSFKPMGTLAKKELRKLRNEAHKAFDPLWKSGKMSRNAAYKFLAKQMKMSTEKCHIAMMSEAQCKKVLEKMSNILIDI